ncbi:MAG: hypothetical protein AAB420_02665 [Patescibacteria group bacterium]
MPRFSKILPILPFHPSFGSNGIVNEIGEDYFDGIRMTRRTIPSKFLTLPAIRIFNVTTKP